ncbi:hypothetical protein AAKU67_003059 [Oxalobacteraceae bacterium GrIS 2.11]
MNNKLLGVTIATLFSVNAFAAGPPPVSTSSTTNVSATGGAGGAGGSATGGSATGGSAIGNSSTMTATSTSSGNSTATGNNVNVSVTVPETAPSTSTTPAANSAQAGVPGSDAYNTKMTIDNTGTSTIKTAPPVAAPALTTTLSDTCMGSMAFGVSFTGFGASGGKTVVDEACVRRLDSREFRAMGMPDVALALLCQSPANKKAVEDSGHECPGSPRPAKTVSMVTGTANKANASPVIQEPELKSAPVTARNSSMAGEEVAPSARQEVSAEQPSDQISSPDPILRFRLSQDEPAVDQGNK